MEKETHYKKMLKRIIEIFQEYRSKKCTVEHVQNLVYDNIEAIDNLTEEFRERTEIFTGEAGSIARDYKDKDQYNKMVALIEEYEPYIQELLKIDRLKKVDNE